MMGVYRHPFKKETEKIVAPNFKLHKYPYVTLSAFSVFALMFSSIFIDWTNYVERN